MSIKSAGSFVQAVQKKEGVPREHYSSIMLVLMLVGSRPLGTQARIPLHRPPASRQGQSGQKILLVASFRFADSEVIIIDALTVSRFDAKTS